MFTTRGEDLQSDHRCGNSGTAAEYLIKNMNVVFDKTGVRSVFQCVVVACIFPVQHAASFQTEMTVNGCEE